MINHSDDFKIEILHKEIDLIQSCINRMAPNSFLVKGWMLTISGIILTFIFNKNDGNTLATWVVFLIIVSFWYLDAFFLRTERMYRSLYKWVIENRKETDKMLYDLNPYRFEGDVGSTWKVMRSKTLLVFYFIPLLSIVILNIFYLFR